MFRALQVRPAVKWLAFGTVLAFFFNLYATQILNESYAASLFPVPYFEAQLSFDASRLKGWYAYLMERNTLGLYVQTQNIDFIFIVSVLALHFLALMWVSRLFSVGSRLRRWMVAAALLSSLAPLFDALENLVSYVMLGDPARFADGWALLYSSFAAAKFAMFTFAYVAGALGIVVGLAQLVRRRLAERNGKREGAR